MNSEDRSSKDDESVASSGDRDSKNSAGKAERFRYPFAFVSNMPDPRSRSLDGIAVTDSLDSNESDASLERRQRSLLSAYTELDTDPIFADMDRCSGRVNTIPEDMAEFIKAKLSAEQEKTNTAPAEAPNNNAKRDYSTFVEPDLTEDDAPPERESKRRRQIGWGDTFAHLNEGKWQCAACLVYTVDEESKCSACEIPRPSDTNAQGETTTATMAAATPNLGLGAPASGTFSPPMPHGTSSNVGFRFAPPSTAPNTGFIFGSNVASSTTLPSSQSTSMAPAHPPAHPFVFGPLAPAPTGNALSGTFVFATTGGEETSAPPPRRVTPMPPVESGLVNADSTPFVFGVQPPPLVPQQAAAMEPSTSVPANVQSPSLVGMANSANEAPRGLAE
jgi:hypothetical protein